MNHWIERNGGHLIVLLLSLILNGALVLILHGPIRTTLQITPSTPSPTPSRVRVYVSGAVVAPDVYELPLGALVRDALLAAGGGTADAELSQINLAQEVKDQSQVNVPARRQVMPALPTSPASAPSSPAASDGSSGPIDLNTADLAELQTLPGVGPTLAQRIVDFRTQNGPFASVEGLREVKGIGPATFEKLKDYVRVP
jgi:competence protein ComEA